jgi:hypothetical protein
VSVAEEHPRTVIVGVIVVAAAAVADAATDARDEATAEPMAEPTEEIVAPSHGSPGLPSKLPRFWRLLPLLPLRVNRSRDEASSLDRLRDTSPYCCPANRFRSIAV